MKTDNYATGVSPIEKFLSVISYLTMGIAGLIVFILLTKLVKRRLKYFLMYNIFQSMIISLFLALFGYTVQLVLSVLSKIPFLDFLTMILNLLLSFKILIIRPLGMQFSIFELFVVSLLLYIITGVIMGKIFYIPFLSSLMNKTMKRYY